MNNQLKKLKGSSVKTEVGEFTLKEYLRPENSEFDQIFFKTNSPTTIIKIYELARPVSIQRYHNEIHHYANRSLPMLHSNVHAERLTLKKKDYGIIVFLGLSDLTCLSDSITNLTPRDQHRLAISLLENLMSLKEGRRMFCNFRPENIYKVDHKYVLINAQFMTAEAPREDMSEFLIETVEKDWEYWAPEILDPYFKGVYDYSLDVFAVGCILYQALSQGVYPFESKLTAQSNFYAKIQDKGILGHLVNFCLDTPENRRNLKLRQLIKQISELAARQSPRKDRNLNATSQLSISQDKNIRKGSGTGFLDNISTAFSKMMNDTEGFYLNYVEDNPKPPQEKFLDNILVKLYRSQEKADKLSGIIVKHIMNSTGKIFPAQKTLLLIGQIFRKGPRTVCTSFSQCLQIIDSNFKQYPQVTLFCQLLTQKQKLMQKVKKCLTGNFYLQEISNFKQLTISDLGEMAIYMQKVITFVKALVKNKSEEASLDPVIVTYACDDIFDLVSMLVVSVICIRRDNDLQLRCDNMKDLKPLEAILKSCLKNISDLSNYVGAHAIYSLEREYISYQEEISLRTNPYYSTLEHFYRSSRNYKGLSIPDNFQAIYKQKDDKKRVQISPTLVETPTRKQYFAGEEVQSDEEPEGRVNSLISPQQEISALSLFDEFSLRVKQSPKKQSIKHDMSHQQKHSMEARSKDDQKSSRGSKKSKNQSSKTGSISFADFGNIHITKSEKTEKTSPPAKVSDFQIFNELKSKDKVLSIKSPPLPIKKPKPKRTLQKNGSMQKSINFDEFSQVIDDNPSKKKQDHSASCFNVFNEFEHMKKKQKTSQKTNQEDLLQSYNKMFGQGFQMDLKPVEVNPLVEKIMSGLKLKQLKQLLTKNQHLVIEFNSLKIAKHIGNGSAGQVYLGSLAGKQVAIKKVKAKQNPNALKQFERELVTYIKIGNNPYLVCLVGLSECKGDFYLITQFCSSGSLFDLLHKKRLQIILSWRDRLRFAIEIAEGMKFLHMMKPVIIHRDLKSLNVFVATAGDKFLMKVADFGLSRSPEAEMMTTQLGTIHWMAPELLEGKQYSLKVDVYSYGILLWEILSRKTPYSNLNNVMGIIKYVAMDHKRPDLEAIPGECPRELVQVMQKCWAHEPQERPDFSHILEALYKIKI